jgi:hypothetical protein
VLTFGGFLPSSTLSACSTGFEKRGPMGTHSTIFSIESTTMMLIGDLYESLKTLLR